MKVLLCVDSSNDSQAAVRAVATQHKPTETQVRILHVLQPISLSAAPQMDPMFTPELEAAGSDAKKLVDRIASELRSAGFHAELVIAKGDIRETIVHAAAQWPADLIVVGSRGRGGLRSLLLGSVAEFVVRHAPCSVLIARANSTH